ncbi:UDP-glucose dehydrogenase family protein [Nocardioides sp.]|uniref:UDP-glucose dehydrogenase family protein n=1 Tax=Nocardioides sp. TaxID=35761 RepID=UPI002ED49FA5
MALRVSVIGSGYLGTTHAAGMAEAGWEVLGVDIDEAKVAALARGELPFYEPGLGDLVRKHVAGGRLRFTTSFEECGSFGDVHFLCVGTPQRPGELGADLGQLRFAVESLAPHLRRQCVVVGKSTVPVGTAERLAAMLATTAPADGDVELAWNPEFLREGHAVEDTLRPDRIVIGVQSEIAEKVLRELYVRQLRAGVPLVVTDLPTAELVKVAANAFLATKISFINMMADLCEATGGDVTALADALGRDDRIGERFLHAGLGFGGGCLPKDIRALAARADELGVPHAATLLREVDRINLGRRTRMVQLAVEACGGNILGKRVGVLGTAFKPRSDDVRDSPALNVAAQLQLIGAHVRVYDPVARSTAESQYPTLEYVSSAVEAAADADLLLHLTEWQEFLDLDPCDLDGVVARKYILDGRNALDAERWRVAGWNYRALGRP